MKKIVLSALLITTNTLIRGIDARKNLLPKEPVYQTHQQEEFDEKDNKMLHFKLPNVEHNEINKIPGPIKTTLRLIGITIWLIGYFCLLEHTFTTK